MLMMPRAWRMQSCYQYPGHSRANPDLRQSNSPARRVLDAYGRDVLAWAVPAGFWCGSASSLCMHVLSNRFLPAWASKEDAELHLTPLSLLPGVKYGSRNVLADPAIRDGVKKFSNWPTIPQVGRSSGMGREGGGRWVGIEKGGGHAS